MMFVTEHRYLTSKDRHPLIICGSEGSGKTSLLARAAQHCHAWVTEGDVAVVLRFAGLTPDSLSVLTLLHSIARQVSLLLRGRLPQVPHVTPSTRSWSSIPKLMIDVVCISDAA